MRHGPWPRHLTQATAAFSAALVSLASCCCFRRCCHVGLKFPGCPNFLRAVAFAAPVMLARRYDTRQHWCRFLRAVAFAAVRLLFGLVVLFGRSGVRQLLLSPLRVIQIMTCCFSPVGVASFVPLLSPLLSCWPRRYDIRVVQISKDNIAIGR